MTLRIEKDIFETRDARDLKYISMKWVSQVGKDESDDPVAQGPQGDPATQDWYTQTERADLSKIDSQPEILTPEQQVAIDSELYDQWATMHDSSVVWYDTAGCNLSKEMRRKHGYIGGANKVQFVPTAPWFNNPKRYHWYVGTEE